MLYLTFRSVQRCGSQLAAAEHHSLGDDGAGEEAHDGLHQTVDTHKGDDEQEGVGAAHSLHKALNEVGVVEAQAQGGHEEQRVAQRAGQAGGAEGQQAGLIHLAQRLKHQTADPARQDAGGYADKEGEKRVDAHQHHAKGALAKAFPEADEAEYTAQQGTGGGTHDDGSHDDRYQHDGDLQARGLDHTQARQLQQQHDGDQYRQLYQIVHGKFRALRFLIHYVTSCCRLRPAECGACHNDTIIFHFCK